MDIAITLVELSKSCRSKIKYYKPYLNSHEYALDAEHMINYQKQHLANLVEIAKKLGYTDENFLQSLSEEGSS